MADKSLVKSKFMRKLTFTTTGVVGNELGYYIYGENKLRVSHNMAGTESVQIQGRLENDTEWTTLDTITGTGAHASSEINVASWDYVRFNVSLSAAGGTIIASAFFSQGGVEEFVDLTDTPSSFVGEALKVARVNAGETALEFAVVAGTGDVVGPAVAVANNVALFDGTSGKLLKDAGVSISGSNTGDQVAGDFNHDDLASITGTAGQYNHPTDANMTVLGNTSGTNTGDQASGDFDHDALVNTHNLTTDIDHDALTNTHNLTTDIDHDALTNFVANEHIDWTNASTALVTTGNVTCNDLTVNGTTTTINSTTLTVDDKNIEIGSVAVPSDTTADGGGITLKGATDKTLIWDNANDNWTSNQNWNIATGLDYKVNNVSVLNATTLGSAVVNSSLTNLGTLSALGVTGASGLDGAVTINESGADVDFRVEGVGVVNALFVQGSDGNVGIGTSSPDNALSIARSAAASIENIDSYSTTDSHTSRLYFRKSASDTIGTVAETADGELLGLMNFYGGDNTNAFDTGAQIAVIQNGASGAKVPADIVFSTSTSAALTETMRMTSAGDVGVGITPTYRFDVLDDGANAVVANYATDNQYSLLQVKNTKATATTNYAGFSTRMLTTVQERDCFRFDASFSDNTDATRTTLVEFKANNAGSFSTSLAIKGGNVGIGDTSPSQKFVVADSGAAVGDQIVSIEKTGTSANAASNYYMSFVSATTADGYIWNNGSSILEILQGSDERLKTNIKDADYGLKEIMALRPVNFDWKEESAGKNVKGFIAQEVQKVLPKSVNEMPNGYLGLGNSEFIPTLVKAVQELTARIEELEK